MFAFLSRWLQPSISRVVRDRPRTQRRNPARRFALEELEARLAPAFVGGVSVATGDVNGDGVTDIVTGAGPGGGPNVRAFSGRDGTLLLSLFAFAPGFPGGTSVAVGDLNADGFADIVTGAGPGGARKSVRSAGATAPRWHTWWPTTRVSRAAFTSRWPTSPATGSPTS
jgi:hypothetical protein